MTARRLRAAAMSATSTFPSLHPKQEPDKTAVEAPPDVIAADTAMEELTECPALPASAEDEAAGWDWNETNIDEFEED